MRKLNMNYTYLEILVPDLNDPSEETIFGSTFYNNLTDCLRDIPLHNFIVLMGDLNARVESSDTHLKAVGRYAYHQVSNDNGNRLIGLCEANNVFLAAIRKPYPNRHKWSSQHPNGNKAQLNHLEESGLVHFKVAAATRLLRLIQTTALSQLP